MEPRSWILSSMKNFFFNVSKNSEGLIFLPLQGFNMLGALILQVMDKNDIESLKVMIFLIEGILPPGYFCGSLGGLQVDMAVFREILLQRLPKLAKHLQRLQGPIGEGSFVLFDHIIRSCLFINVHLA